MTSIERFATAGSWTKATSRCVASLALLIPGMLVSGCASGSTVATTSSTQLNGPRAYMAPYVVGDTAPGNSVSAYQIDDTAQSFTKSTYALGQVDGAAQLGARIYYAGTTTSLKRGLLSLGTTYEFLFGGNITTYSTPQTGSWAVELPNQSGGLVQLLGQPVEPIVPATNCPDFKTSQTYWFLTLPTTFGDSRTYVWDPTLETVYGSVDVSGSGSTITFANIQQYALPSAFDLDPTLGPPEPPATVVTSPQTGACSQTYYGNTTVVPANLTVTNPGPGSATPTVSVVGIGPTGLLVESNAADGESRLAPFYQDLLGAGTGAIGLPKPSSALDTSALVGAQYLGFDYGAGSGHNDWSSLVTSFGFATQPAGCQSVASQTSTMIYGGDFNGNNPAAPGIQANGGFGNCDIAIDLGTQDPDNNGLYPAATVYVGPFYVGNQTGADYNFPAVAIAGQLGGKYAIFLLGVDFTGFPNQAWGIYLLQSN